MLERIVQRKEDAKFILIEDDVNSGGMPLLESLIMDSLKRSENIHLIQYDRVKSDSIITKIKNYENNDNVMYYDGATDPLNWNSSTDGGDTVGYELDFLSHSIKGGIVVINSLTPLIINQPVNNVYRQLHHLKTKLGCKIIALLHIDVHDKLETKIIEQLADCILKLSSCSNKLLMKCVTTLRKQNGKISINNEHFKIDSNYIVILEELKASNETVKMIDPASNLTFNLTLKDDEKVARQELVLPYTQVSNISQGGGQIIYNLDSVDDFDEDDPDDDLDI